MAAKIDLEKCTQCGTCAEHCPEDVIHMGSDDYPEVRYPYECWYCGACLIDCPVEAIELELPLFMRLIPEPYGLEILKPTTSSGPRRAVSDAPRVPVKYPPEYP